jgi:signal peptidase II
VKEVIEGYIALRYVENVGGAWGCLSEAPEEFRYPFFVIASLVAMIFIIVVYHRADPKERLLKIALGLVLGGAIGNFADRVRLYYVIDFIDLHIEDKFHWPTFNIADAAISIGVGLMIFDMLPSRRKKKQAES